MDLPAFQKNFYREHEEVTAFSEKKVDEIRKFYEVQCFGEPIPKPIETFEQSSFPGKISH